MGEPERQIAVVNAEVPELSVREVKLVRIYAEWSSHDSWWEGYSLQEAAQEMADALDKHGWDRVAVEALVRDVGADPEELIW